MQARIYKKKGIGWEQDFSVFLHDGFIIIHRCFYSIIEEGVLLTIVKEELTEITLLDVKYNIIALLNMIFLLVTYI